jgi:hypothetical protein
MVILSLTWEVTKTPEVSTPEMVPGPLMSSHWAA